ncbi:MAG: Asp-tRNA(Asn)/Glu-tRNA(Gln) amidotransferase GatCAB subunit A [Zetaproteobacteria bacterium CG06_land_8_20_14_3_00_59_53]|nr:MAG: aspartyl/glutamyl-tRNA amidotransferase subunit A [Zetaproteobacteria bacterium CG2_30_59_37]PIO89466.1 MAG: Asp-tRNA(Asn)/Glu-tRNA(Gln) amidotransferase GatCAB subunit A [Zetaproteobacteria bacterium CG23_combo_of_CG06-09_8_20_14_all_59_86]PIQ65491.1 MAG: Asp-tRNA(Asn)/Glu-tRNA(Gln) amidotransferase GatCAB subunit A [Zetaproteobacteria bacterium CG11_big_fil_rev_8_21_14_0_20_59_439]PIU69743.1 MAG: Asp-tRNA(Asn)/Glu-tRNA(Gln) amidotransferase GatCAB subunit A [Zetaproteobacteria bacteriu
MPFSTLSDLKARLDAGETTAVELAKLYLARIDAYNGELNAFVDVDHQHILDQAKASDAHRAKHGARELEGLPIAIKDIFCTQDGPTTCCSNILKGFHAPYDAHVITRLKNAGAVLLGKTNMDEFAMGSSTETSAFGPCRNPWDTARIPGGSSGGSASAVAGGLAPAALGTDTGGSIRQPAAVCGITGLKPTYGRVSRRGIIAFASSLDQAGPMTRTVKDTAMISAVLCGHDSGDSTSVVDAPAVDWLKACEGRDMKGLKIGKPKEYFVDGMDAAVRKSVEDALAKCVELGAEIVDISLPHTKYAVAAYYVIAPSEASANLSRYDGVRFGHRCENPDDLLDMYTRSRDEGFGDEVKRRILTGTFALSSGYYDAYYLKAQQVRTLIRQDFLDAFDKVDIIATPTSPIPAFKIGEKADDPITMYLSDIFTIALNLAGLPGMSQPCGFVGGLPVGLQWIAPAWREDVLLAAGSAYEAATDWTTKAPASFGGAA